MADAVKLAVSAVLDGLLSVPVFGRINHRLYDLATRLRPDTARVRNAGFLGAKVMRGAQPSPRGFAALREQGVETVVNLRPESDWEERVVRECGMRYYKVPLSVMGSPTFEAALAFLDIATDPATGLVFVHCFHGSDRTGAIGAVYRIAADGWDLDGAIAEMRRYGFHDGYQDSKLQFVREFQACWLALPAERRGALLHAI